MGGVRDCDFGIRYAQAVIFDTAVLLSLELYRLNLRAASVC